MKRKSGTSVFLLAGFFCLSLSCRWPFGIPSVIVAEPDLDAEFDSLTIPPADAQGWTIIHSSADTRTIYVSESGGLDTNDGLTENTPVQSISEGMSRLRNGHPDHLLLSRGDQWNESIVRNDHGFRNITYAHNRYHSARDVSFQVDTDVYGDNFWPSLSGETGAAFGPVSYSHPSRTLESYFSSIGGDGTAVGFITQAKNISRMNWNIAYTAAAINNYLRAGCDMDTIGSTY